MQFSPKQEYSFESFVRRILVAAVMLATIGTSASGQNYPQTQSGEDANFVLPSQGMSPAPMVPEFQSLLPQKHRELLQRSPSSTQQPTVPSQNNQFSGLWPQGSKVVSPLQAIGIQPVKNSNPASTNYPTTDTNQTGSPQATGDLPQSPVDRYPLNQTHQDSVQRFRSGQLGSPPFPPTPAPNFTQASKTAGSKSSGNNVWSSDSGSKAVEPKLASSAEPFTPAQQDRIRKMIEKVLVDPEKKYPVRPQPYPLEPDYPLPLRENLQSDISPQNWGSNDFESAKVFQGWPQDPPIYDRENDPGKPKRSLREVLYKGRKFASFDLLFLEPRYKSNAALTIRSSSTTTTVSSDFELEFASRIGFGFESDAGPGGEFFYGEYDQTSQVRATSGAGTDVFSEVILSPANNSLRLTTFAPGQDLTVSQSTDVQYFDAMFFKFLKFKVAALVGHIGLRYAEIDHEHRASLTNAGGTMLGQLTNENEFRGFGPRMGISYIRPIGHTRLRMVGHLAGSILAGDRAQYAFVTGEPLFINDPSEQIISTLEMRLGIEWAYNVSDSTSFYSRVSYESQSWFNGGTPIDPNSSFGLSGLVFGLGFSR